MLTQIRHCQYCTVYVHGWICPPHRWVNKCPLSDAKCVTVIRSWSPAIYTWPTLQYVSGDLRYHRSLRNWIVIRNQQPFDPSLLSQVDYISGKLTLYHVCNYTKSVASRRTVFSTNIISRYRDSNCKESYLYDEKSYYELDCIFTAGPSIRPSLCTSVQRGFRAFAGEPMEEMAWNFACWCIVTTFRTD